MPNHVKDMAVDEGDIESVVDATVAGVPVQTGARETIGIDTRNAKGLIDIDELLSVDLLDAYDGDADLMANAEESLDKAAVRDGLRRGHVSKCFTFDC